MVRILLVYLPKIFLLKVNMSSRGNCDFLLAKILCT